MTVRAVLGEKMKIVDETRHIRIVEQEARLIDEVDGERVLKKIELCGRTAYKSEDRITEDSARDFVARIIKAGHESVIEHASITVKAITDRATTHEIVRHRIASYTQESTRYCNYAKEKFGSKVWMVRPIYLEVGSERYEQWKDVVDEAAKRYLEMVQNGWKPEEARAILPNSTKAEICITMNLREWRHFFKLRCSPAAHPQIRDLANKILVLLRSKIPVVFDEEVQQCRKN